MIQILQGDCREVLKTLPDCSVHCCVTSPPYFGLRSYGIGTENGEIGLESTPDAYVAELVAVFREVRRVLRGNPIHARSQRHILLGEESQQPAVSLPSDGAER